MVYKCCKLILNKVKCECLPDITLSPICISDIVTDFPFLITTLAVEGKQEFTGGGVDGGGGVGGGGAVVGGGDVVGGGEGGSTQQ